MRAAALEQEAQAARVEEVLAGRVAPTLEPTLRDQVGRPVAVGRLVRAGAGLALWEAAADQGVAGVRVVGVRAALVGARPAAPPVSLVP